MSKKQKLTIRLLKVPKDFTWDELHAALLTLGFEEITNSKTCGSRRKFYHSKLELIVNLHKPHPSVNKKVKVHHHRHAKVHH